MIADLRALDSGLIAELGATDLSGFKDIV
jgi:hypothetical protein